MSDFTIECSECDIATQMQTSAMSSNQGRSFDANKRAVYHVLETGGGYEALSSFCSIMNMPCLSKQAYYKQVDVILAAQESEAQAELCNAATKLRNLLANENGTEEAAGDIIDVTVSFDGIWAKRGFTSLFGVFFVMSVDTGEGLDYHILSKFCQKCLLKKSQCDEQSQEFQEWRAEHIAKGECDVNFQGSSPAMEAEAAQVLWNRSIDKRKMGYTHMVSDDDSKSFSAVHDQK